MKNHITDNMNIGETLITKEDLSRTIEQQRVFYEHCLMQIKKIVASHEDKTINMEDTDVDYIFAVVGFDYETREERVTTLSIGSCGELVLETESGYTVTESEVCYREAVYPKILAVLMDAGLTD